MAKQNTRHFIDLDQIPAKELQKILALAKKLKKEKNAAKQAKILPQKNLAMIFEKTSTRTRVSFEVGINQLGGHAIVMNSKDMQLGKGESIEDTAKVLSRFVDGIMIRSNSHQTILELAKHASVPVINALSDFSHPCQILASIMTIEEYFEKLDRTKKFEMMARSEEPSSVNVLKIRAHAQATKQQSQRSNFAGYISGKKLAWFGDANNVLNSYIHAAKAFNFELAIATPKEFDFCNVEIKKAQKNGAKISCFTDAKKAAKDADVLISDTWFSMGDAAENDDALRQKKLNVLMPYQINSALMKLAKKHAIFTHCLPAYRGFEVTADVIDSKKSVVFDEAENRLHAQKAILIWAMS